MHEFSVADEVIRLVKESAKEGGVQRVNSVSMAVGAMSCLHPPALETAFSALTDGDDMFAGASLEVIMNPVVIACADCGELSEIDAYAFICPGCGSVDVEIVSGEEILINAYDGE